MLKNYILITWRSMLRNKTNSLINIFGLAVGIASFIFILLFVKDELKYDTFLEKADRIYQVDLNSNFGGQDFYIGKTPASVSAALVRNFPEIEYASRVYRPGDVIVRSTKNNTQAFTETAVLAVDSNFLDVFSFKLKEGNRKTCLQDPDAVLITESAAKKYFGNEDPLGKMLLIDKEGKPCKVSAVLENVPSQSSLQFDILMPVSAFPVVKKMSWSWIWLQVCTYIKLKDNADNSPAGIQRIEEKFPSMIRVEAMPAFKRIGKPFDEFVKKGGRWELSLQPYMRIHLFSVGIGQVLSNVGDIKYVYIFSCIALIMLLLACVNFMNLSTAQSMIRAKEIGVRKVLGSDRGLLIRQFMAEALFYSFCSSLIALAFVIVCINPFNALSGKDLHLTQLLSDFNWLWILLLTIITGLLAGSYPAFYLSSLKPVSIIKGIGKTGDSIKDIFVRNGLVVFQFTVSTALIICTIVVFRQMKFMREKDLGLSKDNIIIVKNTALLGEKAELFRNEAVTLPSVMKASIATGVPTRENFGDGYVPEVSTPGEHLVQDLGLSSFIVDEGFIPALDIKLLSGRNFSKDFADSTSVILNEEAVKQIGWKNPVGSYMTYPGHDNQRFKVIAVVKNFHISSLHDPVTPFALFYTSSKTYDLGLSYAVIKAQPGSAEKVTDELKEKWTVIAPAVPFELMFLDSEFDALYKTEKKLGHVFFVFTMLSVIVACLGLLGLVIFSIAKRRKEVGIRKVLGASVSVIVLMLTRDFMKLVLIASFIAMPLAWWGMSKWLEEFAYRITIGYTVFASAIILSALLTLLTVGWQTVKAALANPVKSLRTE